MYVQYIKGDQAIMPLAVWSIPNFSAVFVIVRRDHNKNK